MTNSIVSTHVLVSDYLSLSFLILVLFQELDMEVTKPAQHACDDVLLSKDGRSEVESSWSLTEARTRNDTNARGFKQGKSIEGVSSHAGLLSGCYGLLRQVNLGEGVHGALHSVAADPLDRVEGVRHQLRALGQRRQDPVNLCLPAGKAWVAFPGWVDNNIHASLPYHSWAELSGDTLLQHGHHFRVHI